MGGLCKQTFTDGTLSAAGKYAKGKKTGTWKYYFRKRPAQGHRQVRGRSARWSLEMVSREWQANADRRV